MTHQPLLTLNWNMLFSLITVVVLILILKKFFFEKVHNFMVERQQKIEEDLKNARNTTDEANALKSEYENQLQGAESEKKAILESARLEARAEADKLIQDARIEATKIREENEAAIEQRKEEAKRELENEVSELAILAAQKILQNNATEAVTGVKGDILTENEEMSIRRQVDELKIHMNQEENE